MKSFHLYILAQTYKDKTPCNIMIYKCKRCGYITEKLANLKHHYNRKQTCKDSLKCGKTYQDLLSEMERGCLFNCPCGQFFESKQGLNQHKSFCQESEDLQKQVENLLEENKQLKEQLKYSTQTVLHDTSISNNVANTKNIYNFGNEDILHVVQDKTFLADCFAKIETSGIVQIVENIYFNDDYPKNQTIKMVNINKDHVMIRENNLWVRQHIAEPVQKIIQKSKDILYTLYIASNKYHKIVNNSCEEENKRYVYLCNVGIAKTKENKETFLKVKSVLSNYKYKE